MTSTTADPTPQGASGLGAAFLSAWVVAGTLDILDAVVLSLVNGKSPIRMLQGIASAIYGKAAGDGGMATAAFGLGLHFAIMAVMVLVFVLAASRVAALTRRPLIWGLLYGLGLYVVMNWIVLPLRWPGAGGLAKPDVLINQLFAHLVLVGLPISFITARLLKRSGA